MTVITCRSSISGGSSTTSGNIFLVAQQVRLSKEISYMYTHQLLKFIAALITVLFFVTIALVGRQFIQLLSSLCSEMLII